MRMSIATCVIVLSLFIVVQPHPIAAADRATSGLDSEAYAITSWDSDGDGPKPPLLVVGGFFSTAGGIRVNHLAAWDGNSWQSIGNGTDYSVHALIVYHGKLIAAGSFVTAGGTNANYTDRVARYGPPLPATIGGVTVNGIAQWDGNSWQPLGTSMDANSRVEALAVYNDQLIAAGDFITAGGLVANRIAAWDGVSWHTLGTGMDDRAVALTVYKGELIAGGRFKTAGGTNVSYIARWDGNRWRSIGDGFPTPLQALTVYNGQLIAGGLGIRSPSIQAWDGNKWHSLGNGVNGAVSKLIVYKDRLIVSGHFKQAGDVSAKNIAQWDGNQWLPIGDDIGDMYGRGYVYALGVHNGQLIAGGSFAAFGKVSAHNIAQWDGASWQPLGDGK